MRLRDIIFRNKKKASSELKGVVSNAEVDLILDHRIDAEKIRNIWNNYEKDYKLSASVVICGINALVDYIGIPVVTGGGRNRDKIQKHVDFVANSVHKKGFVEGNFFLWACWNDKKNDIDNIIYNFESMRKPVFDIDTKELLEVSFEHDIEFNDAQGNRRRCRRIRRFTQTHIYTRYEGDRQEGKEDTVIAHNLGRLPVVFVRYNRSLEESYGHGLIEATEPYLRVLSSVLLNRAIEDRRSSRRKLNITARDAESWLANTAMVNGVDTNGIDLESLDILFNTIGDDGVKEESSYINVTPSAQDSLEIAKTMYACIREIMGTPEWIFPSKLGASFASVEAQVPSWIQHIETLRNNEWYTNWIEILELYNRTFSLAQGTSVKPIDLHWKRLDLETPELRAKIVNYMIASMKLAKENALMTDEEIRDYLDEYLNDLGDYASLSKAMPEMMERLAELSSAKKGGENEDRSNRNRPTEGENLITNENRDKTQA